MEPGPPRLGALLTDSVTILARYFQGCYRPWDTLRALAPGLPVCPAPFTGSGVSTISASRLATDPLMAKENPLWR